MNNTSDIFDDLPLDNEEITEKMVYEICKKNNILDKYDHIINIIKNQQKFSKVYNKLNFKINSND